MWFEFFIIGGLWWWLLTLAMLGGLAFLTEHSNGSGAGFAFVMYLAVIWVFGDFQPLSFLVNNPKTILATIVLFFIIGTLYAMAKWKLYVGDTARVIKQAEADFKSQWTYENSVAAERHDRRTKGEDAKLDPTEAYRRDWLDHASGKSLKLDSLKIRDHKERFVTWLAFWPPSMAWTLIHDPITRMANRIYLWLSGWAQSVSDRAYSGITR